MEDIQHMRRQCAVENMIVFVDSSLRDRRAHPTPAEYVVHFQQPFSNVMGVEVLDAAIPRTMYVVDAHNNHMRLYRSSRPTDPVDVYISPKDYTINEFFIELRDLLAPHGISVTSPSADIKSTSLLHFYSNEPFVLDMDASSAREVLGFDEFARPDDQISAGLYIDAREPTDPAGRKYGAARMDDAPAAALVPFNEPSTYDGQSTELSPLLSISGLVLDLDLAYRFRSAASSARSYRVDLVAIPLYDRSGSPSVGSPVIDAIARIEYDTSSELQATYAVEIVTAATFDSIVRERGFGSIFHPSVSNLTEIANVLMPYHFLLVRYQPTPDRRARESRMSTPFAARLTLTFSSLPSWATHLEVNRTPGSPYVSCAVMVTPHLFTVHAPGMISLVGERYVILRCKEIDENAQIGYAYMNTSPGVALFKLGVMGYADIRLDFASIRYKEFHPIGKLSKLTLRFETLAGTMYDFKGVNHHMLLVIKYYVPTDTTPWTPVLNPSYDPDMTRYQFMQRDDTDDDDSSLDGESSDDNSEEGTRVAGDRGPW